MTETTAFMRLERTISLIARHPFYPGKSEIVHDCLDDLEDRYREGLLTYEQKAILASILTADGSIGAFGNDHSDPSRRSS
jgi:hypothetical protein